MSKNQKMQELKDHLNRGDVAFCLFQRKYSPVTVTAFFQGLLLTDPLLQRGNTGPENYIALHTLESDNLDYSLNTMERKCHAYALYGHPPTDDFKSLVINNAVNLFKVTPVAGSLMFRWQKEPYITIIERSIEDAAEIRKQLDTVRVSVPPRGEI